MAMELWYVELIIEACECQMEQIGRFGYWRSQFLVPLHDAALRFRPSRPRGVVALRVKTSVSAARSDFFHQLPSTKLRDRPSYGTGSLIARDFHWCDWAVGRRVCSTALSMGVGSSREIEEQLEAALSLLDAARAKQEHLKAECDNLQSRISQQSAALLKEEQAKVAGAIHLVQERDPLSKRVLFGLAVTAPLAFHLLLSAISIQIVDSYAFAQGALLAMTVVVLLRFRRYRWRRIRPERVLTSTGTGGETSPRLRLSRSSAESSSMPIQVGEISVQPTHLTALIASEAELSVLREVKDNLRKDPPAPERGGELVPTHEPLLDVQVRG